MRVRHLICMLFVIAMLAIVSPRTDLAQKKKNTISQTPVPTPIQIFTASEAQISAYVNSSGNVKFNGSGYIANEPVLINVRFAAPGIVENVLIGTWTIFADPLGLIVTEWSMSDLAGSYVVEGFGQSSARSAATNFYGPEALTANLDQCGNGPLGAEVPCVGSAWENGNLNASKAHYYEGEAVAYRLRFDGLATNVPHTVTIEWDTTENSGAKHALDYIVSYNFSETGAVPCSGVTGCDPLVFDTFPIPSDPNVAAGNDQIPGNTDDIVQAGGVFTLFGGDITAVSGYTVSGSYSGASHTSITVTFSTTVTNPVLAWGGHISTRMDWGIDHSSIAITGSPFHMRLIALDGSGGNQDRSLSDSAAIFPATLTIIKDAQPDAALPFSFSAVGQPGLSDFTLEDDGDPDDGLSNRKTFTNLGLFGPSNQVVITEAYPGPVFSLGDVTCTSDPQGGTGTNNYTFSLADRNVSVTLEEGEVATCTFVNLVTGPTAGYAYISGRVTDAYGRPISRALISAARISNGEIRYVYTNSFGYYRFEELQAGESYVMTVRAARYRFDPASVAIGLTEDVSDLNFNALP